MPVVAIVLRHSLFKNTKNELKTLGEIACMCLKSQSYCTHGIQSFRKSHIGPIL